MAVPMTPSAAVADFGGWRYRQFIPFNFLLSLAAPHLHGVLVLVTVKKFIAGVVVAGANCSLVSLSPAIKLSPVSLSQIVHRYRRHPRSLKIHDKENFFASVIDTAEQLITGVNDTVKNIHSRISPQIFEKIQKGSYGILEGLGDTDS